MLSGERDEVPHLWSRRRLPTRRAWRTASDRTSEDCHFIGKIIKAEELIDGIGTIADGAIGDKRERARFGMDVVKS